MMCHAVDLSSYVSAEPAHDRSLLYSMVFLPTLADNTTTPVILFELLVSRLLAHAATGAELYPYT